MLQLLVERDQSYEDIGSLLGLEVEEVRERARAALGEIGGEDPDREVGLTDYLLGQADPIARADVARQLQTDPGSRALAEKLIAQLRLLAPGAELPTLPASKAAKTEPPERPAAGLGSISGRQRRLIGALLGGAALVALIVLLATGAFSGDDGGGGQGESGDQTTTTTASNQGGGDQLTKAVLSPVGGGEAQGVAIFGRIRNVPALEVRAVGLEPSSGEDDYSVWLYRSERVALRIGAVKVGESGRILSQIPVPAEALGFVANGTFDTIVVSNTNTAEFRREVDQAREQKRLPRFTGEPVLRGEITGPAVEQPTGGGAGGAGSGSADGGAGSTGG